MRSVLRKGDGFPQNTPHLRDEVKRLQGLLARAGFATDRDGLFGDGTRRAVEAFQRARGLAADGVVGPATWDALDPALAAPSHPDVAGFETFRGDLAWIHQWEGHAGHAYWPMGASGVTLDPGWDLGQHSMAETKKLYGDILTRAQLALLGEVSGLKGDEAGAAFAARPDLAKIKVSKRQALALLPHLALPYWVAITKRFGVLAEPGTPGSVQTALLSLAYNRGAASKGLAVLTDPLARRRWLEVADGIGAMQQDHALKGIRARRRAEADLIRHQVELG